MQYSIVNKNHLDKIALRIDAEFYHPDFLQLEKKIASLKTITVKKAHGELDCSAFYPSIVEYYNLEKMGVPFLRVDEIQDGFLRLTPDTVFVPLETILENKGTIARCHPRDIVIAKGGNTIAKVALLTDEFDEYAVCRDLIVLRTKKLVKLNKYFLWMFLHSEYGTKSLLRTASQTGQPHLTIEAIYMLHIPKFSQSFQDRFEKLHFIMKKQQVLALNNYKVAEQILLSELGILDWKPKQQRSFLKNFSDTQSADRIDAEYFQPMYDDLISRIKKYKAGYRPLGKIVKIKDKNIVPEDTVTYKYIELANISTNGNINGFIEAKGSELPTRARRKVNTGDVIVSSIEGSLSCIALITDHLNNALCSTGFYVVDSHILYSETLLVLLKSSVGQLQLKKGCAGTILTAISKDEFERIILPKISKPVQKEIRKRIIAMYEATGLSKSLLNIAKHGVELAIETDEKTAEKWINQEVKSLCLTIT